VICDKTWGRGAESSRFAPISANILSLKLRLNDSLKFRRLLGAIMGGSPTPVNP
jgi:hypothetical protein